MQSWEVGKTAFVFHKLEKIALTKALLPLQKCEPLGEAPGYFAFLHSMPSLPNSNRSLGDISTNCLFLQRPLSLQKAFQ